VITKFYAGPNGFLECTKFPLIAKFYPDPDSLFYPLTQAVSYDRKHFLSGKQFAMIA
jgi:hypothetical protein